MYVGSFQKLKIFQADVDEQAYEYQCSNCIQYLILQERCGKVTGSCRKTTEIAGTWNQYSGRNTASTESPELYRELPVSGSHYSTWAG